MVNLALGKNVNVNLQSINIIWEHAKLGRYKNMYVGSLLCYLLEAFDCVVHTTPCFCKNVYGFCGVSQDLLYSYLMDHRQSVILKGIKL